jgi:hypothetical protein
MAYARVAVPRRVGVIAVVVVLTGMLVGVEDAGACSCVPFSAKKLLKGADGAFNGRLLSVRRVEGTAEAALRYRVGVVAKGPFRRGRVVTVFSTDGDTICGLPQTTGTLYGLFVSSEGGRWTGGLCSTISPSKMRRVGRGGTASSAGCLAGG